MPSLIDHKHIEVKPLEELVLAGLSFDGSHHKQWFLEEIAKLLGYDEEYLDKNFERGIAP